jgi:predicted dehydrogenase
LKLVHIELLVITKKMKNATNLAVVGAGGFAYFAVTEFVKIPGVKLVGVFDDVIENTIRFKELGKNVTVFDSLEELYARPEINLVYIATPPYLHYPQSRLALLAGKNVICEKPAAVKLNDALELHDLAKEKDLLFVVNLMQRYNYLYEAVKLLIERKVLGEFLHGFFENYASDEFLKAPHWFWDEQKSGGIFIEHGVHFFDMFSGWFGVGKVIGAQKSNRPYHESVWDKAHATVLYANGLVNFYHAFDQPKVMDRQEMRLLFEKGEITLYEWVPTSLIITALCSEADLIDLKEIFPHAEINILERNAEAKVCHGRFKEIRYNYKIKFNSGEALPKQALYQQLVTDMFNDQLAWIEDRSHVRKITSENAVNSLKLAERADKMAAKIFADQ